MDVAVFDAEDDAKAVGAHLLDGADKAATKAAHDVALTRAKSHQLGVSRTVLRNMVADADLFFAPAATGAGLLVGAKRTLSLDVRDPTGTFVVGRFNGEVTVIKAHDTIADAFEVSFQHEGNTHTAVVAKAALAATIADPLVGSKVKMALDVRDSSDTFVVGRFDGEVSIVKAHDTIKDAYEVSFQYDGAAHTTVVGKAAITAAAASSHTPLFRPPITPVPTVIGQFKLAAALQTLAVNDAAWKAFLGASVKYTFVSDRHESGATADFLKVGAVDSYLKRAGATVETITAHSTAASLDNNQLLAVIMFDFVPKEPSLPSGPSPGESNGKLNVNVLNEDNSGTEEERRLRLAIRDDFSQLEESKSRTAELAALTALKDQPAALAVKVRELDDSNGLKRLLSSELEVDKTLAGALLVTLSPSLFSFPIPTHTFLVVPPSLPRASTRRTRASASLRPTTQRVARVDLTASSIAPRIR
jgi:hypothetical protein